jgi:hypothetical protein
MLDKYGNSKQRYSLLEIYGFLGAIDPFSLLWFPSKVSPLRGFGRL